MKSPPRAIIQRGLGMKLAAFVVGALIIGFFIGNRMPHVQGDLHKSAAKIMPTWTEPDNFTGVKF